MLQSLNAPLSAKEKKVLEFIESYLVEQEGLSPSYQEIKDHFGFASFNSVQRYLKQLQKKGYIHIPGENQKRAISILKSSNHLKHHIEHLRKLSSIDPFVDPSPQKEASLKEFSKRNSSAELLSLPLFGRVAAGQPLEAFDHDEFIDVPNSLVKNQDHTFALRVEGQSMIEEGIFDGDIVLVQEQKEARNGDLIVATIENEATLKRFYLHTKERKQIELRPANSKLKSLWFNPAEVFIRGKVVGLIRKF